MRVVDEVRSFVVETLLIGDESDFDENTWLLDLIDSSGLVEVVAFIEETYNIHVVDDEIVAENFDTLAMIGSFVSRKLDLNKAPPEIRIEIFIESDDDDAARSIHRGAERLAAELGYGEPVGSMV